MLKAIVDETSHGKYDFMYLRIGEKLHSLFDCKMKLTLNFIDFANNCKWVNNFTHAQLLDDLIILTLLPASDTLLSILKT